MTVKVSKNNSHWVLFLILPFFTAIRAMQNFRAPWAKNILWAFVVFYGFTFTIGAETRSKGEDAGSDINRYVDELGSLYGKPLTLDQSVKYFKESGEADVLRTILSIVVSRFTNSQRVLTAVYAIIFGFFFTRNLWYVLMRLKGKPKFFSLILFSSFFLLDSFWEINGFRFNTAVHIFIYGLLPYLFEGKKRSLWICVSTVLVHFTFIIPITILFIYVILGNRLLPYFIFFIFSIFIKQINVSTFNEFVEKVAPTSFLERSTNYRDTDKVAEFRGEKEPDAVLIEKNWYTKWYSNLLQLSLTLILIFFYFMSKKNIRDIGGLYRAFCFSLLFFAIANILSSLPSGGRFLTIASMVAVAVILFYFQNFSKEQYLKNLMFITTPAFILFIIVSIRIGFYSIGVQTIFGNPILSILTDYNMSLNDIIK